MSNKNPLTEKIRPYATLITAASINGDMEAQLIINLYNMYVDCPSDRLTMAFCAAALDKWLEYNPQA